MRGEQVANPLAFISTFTGGAVAISLAQLMVRQSGKGIYLVERDTGIWTKLSD
jgi:hypothetical protein